MFSPEATRFFLSPRLEPNPGEPYSILYLLRRDIDQCMGLDPNTGDEFECIHPTSREKLHSHIDFPAAMVLLAGIDLLAKFRAGSDLVGEVGKRFLGFLEDYFPTLDESGREAIYQLRNALLHSFGLYSKKGTKVFKFFLSNNMSGPLVSNPHPEIFLIHLDVLYLDFIQSIELYRAALNSSVELQAKFTSMLPNYGFMGIERR